MKMCVYIGGCYLVFCFPFRAYYSISVLKKKMPSQRSSSNISIYLFIIEEIREILSFFFFQIEMKKIKFRLNLPCGIPLALPIMMSNSVSLLKGISSLVSLSVFTDLIVRI